MPGTNQIQYASLKFSNLWIKYLLYKAFPVTVLHQFINQKSLLEQGFHCYAVQGFKRWRKGIIPKSGGQMYPQTQAKIKTFLDLGNLLPKFGKPEAGLASLLWGPWPIRRS